MVLVPSSLHSSSSHLQHILLPSRVVRLEVMTTSPPAALLHWQSRQYVQLDLLFRVQVQPIANADCRFNIHSRRGTAESRRQAGMSRSMVTNTVPLQHTGMTNQSRRL